MTFRLSDERRVTLTPEQQVLLLRVIEQEEHWPGYSEIFAACPLVNDPARRRRDSTAAAALARKGLVNWNRATKTVTLTLEGYWLGDAMRIEARLRHLQQQREEN